MEMYWLLLVRNNISRYNRDGYQVDDIIFHVIKCPKCMQKFTCVVDTYRDVGSFNKSFCNNQNECKQAAD